LNFFSRHIDNALEAAEKTKSTTNQQLTPIDYEGILPFPIRNPLQSVKEKKNNVEDEPELGFGYGLKKSVLKK